MPAAKIGKSKDEHMMHYSVGAIIRRDGRILMIDRAVIPFGFACPAGHIEENESVEEALKREIAEESGMTLIKSKFLFEEEADGNICSRGVAVHYWYVYDCECEGEPRLFPTEEKSIGWYSPEEIRELALEPVWERWLKKLGFI